MIDEETLQLIDKYGDICDDLHTDLHECLGHGSGQLLPGVDPDCLKNYGNTIEEARADLFGLYYIADEKLVELGLTPNMEGYASHAAGSPARASASDNTPVSCGQAGCKST